jgi:hypothetical protein
MAWQSNVSKYMDMLNEIWPNLDGQRCHSIFVDSGSGEADLSSYNVLGFLANNQGAATFTIASVTPKYGNTITNFTAKSGMLYPIALKRISSTTSDIMVMYRDK